MSRLDPLSEFGGYDYLFVSQPPDNLICKICRLPSRSPHMTLCCGHVFCKSCISKVESSSCCVCRATPMRVFENKQVQRDVWSLQIYCINKEKGCGWQGELNSIINSHLKLGSVYGCQYEDVKCGNGCEEIIQRRHFTRHVRKECPCRIVQCPHCHLREKQFFIDGEHMRQCPKLPISCPNKCTSENICRDEMEQHRKQCPLEAIQCKYHSMGCTEKILRKDENTHNKNNVHEHLAMATHALAMQTSVIQELAAIRNEVTAMRQQLTVRFLPNVNCPHLMNTLHGSYV